MFQNLKSWPDFHHRINMVYHGIIAFSLIPFAIIFLEIDSGRSTTSMIAGKFIYLFHFVMIPISLLPIYFSWKGSKKHIENIAKDVSIKEKLASYFKVQARRYLLLESSAITSLACMWLTTNYLYIILYLVVLVQFSLLRPSQDRVIRDMQFTKEEREQLRKESFS